MTRAKRKRKDSMKFFIAAGEMIVVNLQGAYIYGECVIAGRQNFLGISECVWERERDRESVKILLDTPNNVYGRT